MRRFSRAPLMALMLTLTLAGAALAQDKPQGPPPALVVTAPSKAGVVVPRSDFVGTVRFPELSQVATEVGGRVLTVRFEEGDRVAAGKNLVTLDTALLQKRLEAAEAGLREAQASLELARIEFERRRTLIGSGSISQQEFDEASFSVRELESRAASQDAEAARLRLELAKTGVPAPFSGVVLERNVERGEWLSAGATVALVGFDDAMDVMLDVPQEVLAFVAPGQEAEVTVGGKRLKGRVQAVIPKGDVATRTFPVKIRIAGSPGLAEGMEATVHLASGAQVEAVLVPRDAVALMRGQTVIFVPENGAAKLIPVHVVAYEGLGAWVQGPGLADAMPIVVKGKERLYPGAPVRTEGGN